MWHEGGTTGKHGKASQHPAPLTHTLFDLVLVAPGVRHLLYDRLPRT